MASSPDYFFIFYAIFRIVCENFANRTLHWSAPSPADNSFSFPACDRIAFVVVQNCGRRFQKNRNITFQSVCPAEFTLRCGTTEIADNMSARRRRGLRPTLRGPKIATDEARRKPECSNDEYFRTNALLHSDLVIPSPSKPSARTIRHSSQVSLSFFEIGINSLPG